MEMRPLGATGLRVSALGYGALEIGRDWAADVDPRPQHLSEQEAGRVLNGILDRGINFIDTAPAYWYSEEYIGNTISHRRSEYILATKVGEHCDRSGSFYDYTAKATAGFIDRSLQRLKTDYVDLIQIHSASVECLEQGDTWQALDAARKAGKARFIGMTGSVDAAIRAVEIGGYDTVQVPYNLLSPEAGNVLLPLCVEKRVGVIIMRGLAGGKLSAKYQNLKDQSLKAQIAFLESAAAELYPDSTSSLTRAALRFLMDSRVVSTAIIGTRRLEAVDSNLQDLASPISMSESTALKSLIQSH